MPDPAITIRLVGSDEDNGRVRFEDFRQFCDKIAECLRRTETAVTKQPKRIRYRVSDLQASSAQMTLEPIAPKKGPDPRSEVVGLFKKSVADLQAGTFADPRLTPDDLREFRDLYARRGTTKEVWVDGAKLTSQYVANIDRILGSSVGAEGFVTGRLERLNVHNRNEFVLYPPLMGTSIICHFPDGLFEMVRAGIKRNVTVSGTLFHLPDKPFPDRVHVTTLELHPPDGELPNLRDLRGLFPDCTGGMSSVDFVRSLRDEQD